MADNIVTRQASALVRETKARVVHVGAAIALLWGIEIVDFIFMGGSLNQYGVVPRSMSGLAGIALAPFLHSGFAHLIANTIPFAMLGFLASSRKLMDFYVVSIASTLSAGIGVWLLGGAGTVHIGASAVVFGFLGFLMGRGIWERRLPTLALSFLVTFVFGGMLLGITPFVAPGISWLGHLFGWLGGVATAKALGDSLSTKE